MSGRSIDGRPDVQWTYTHRIDLRMRQTWGAVYVQATCEDRSVEWRIEAQAVANDGVMLAGGDASPGWEYAAFGRRTDARMAMEALAAKLAAHVAKARGGA